MVGGEGRVEYHRMKYLKMDWRKLNKQLTFQNFAFLLIGLGIIILIGTLIAYACGGYIQLSGDIDPALSGQFGDFVGGVVGAVWALAGVILFYQTLKLQQVAIKGQEQAIKSQEKQLKAQRRESINARAYNIIYNQQKLIEDIINDFVWFPLNPELGEDRKLEGIYALKRWHKLMQINEKRVSEVYSDNNSNIDQLFRILTNSVILLLRMKENTDMSAKDLRDIFVVFKYNVDDRVWGFIFFLNGKKDHFSPEMKRSIQPKLEKIMEYNSDINYLNKQIG